MEDEGRGYGAFRNGTRAASPQHNEGSIAHYLPFVYYYLVGISLETGTRSQVETSGPSLSPRGCGTLRKARAPSCFR